MTETAKRLLQLGTLQECSARVPTAQEHDREEVPPWCELVLNVQRDNKILVHYLRRHDGEAIIEVLKNALNPHAGKTIQQGIWGDLDEVYASIKDGDKSQLTRGIALGIARALARLRSESVEDIRRQAGVRWRGRNRT